MSKSKKKKQSEQKLAEKAAIKRKKNRIKAVIITAVVLVVAAAAVAVGVILSYNPNAPLYEKQWTSQKAYDASGDEADLYDVYNVLYSQYTGTLNFDKNGEFELWLTAGDPDDGTHKGTYKYEDGVIKAQFTGGDAVDFAVNYDENGEIESISVPYTNDLGSYTVYFY